MAQPLDPGLHKGKAREEDEYADGANARRPKVADGVEVSEMAKAPSMTLSEVTKNEVHGEAAQELLAGLIHSDALLADGVVVVKVATVSGWTEIKVEREAAKKLLAGLTHNDPMRMESQRASEQEKAKENALISIGELSAEVRSLKENPHLAKAKKSVLPSFEMPPKPKKKNSIKGNPELEKEDPASAERYIRGIANEIPLLDKEYKVLEKWNLRFATSDDRRVLGGWKSDIKVKIEQIRERMDYWESKFSRQEALLAAKANRYIWEELDQEMALRRHSAMSTVALGSAL